MIAHLSGTLLEKHLQRLVVDVGGVGYELFVPLSTFYDVGEPGARVSLHVHTHFYEREGSQLFAFNSATELGLFKKLIKVGGIGPKAALAVMSGIEPAELSRAIRNGDVGRLTSIPGVGKKTAERIVMELKEKMAAAAATDVTPSSEGDGMRNDLLSALANLGYQRPSAEKTVDRVLARAESKTFEPLLREVLRELTR